MKTSKGFTLNELQKIVLPSYIAERYHNDYPDNKFSAKEAFRELLKFFWLREKLRRDNIQNVKLSIHPEMREIDDMWHTYILFTKDYEKFCKENFGYFIHHIPYSLADKKEMLKNRENFLKDTELFLSYVYDNLGEETLKLWFADHFKAN
ncbi:hypothetical protein AB8E56_07525 [Francisella sp. 19X1-34]|nr:hypothetical protein [Francisella sp. 19X1-34]